MAELTLVPKPPDYRDDLVQQMRVGAIAELRDAINSLSSGTMALAELSIEKARDLVRFAQAIASQKR